MTIEQLTAACGKAEELMAKQMGDEELAAIAAYTRRQLAMLESEIARRKEQRNEQEGGFAA